MADYNDNLYSASSEESDGESFTDELSPSDGYFRSSSQMPSNIMVPDPTIDYGPAEAKTLIPPPDSQSSTGRSSRLSHHHPGLPRMSASQSYASPHGSESHSVVTAEYTAGSPVSSHHRRQSSLSEHDRLLYNPPPAYSESPPQSLIIPPPSTSPNLGIGRGVYSAFRETHLERGFPLRREPESMGGPIDEPSESTPLTSEGRSYFPRRRKIKGLLLAALVLAVVGSTLSIVFCTREDKSSKFPGDSINSNQSYCPTATHIKDQAVYEFATGRELNVIQTTYGDTSEFTARTVVSTEGEIRLRKTPKNSEHSRKPYVTVDVGTSTELDVVINWSEDSQTLELSTPRYAEGTWRQSQCLYVVVTAYFPEEAEFTTLRFDSTTLNIALSDLMANVTSRSKFTTVSGDIWLDSNKETTFETPKHTSESSRPRTQALVSELMFSSRRIVIETISGSITGAYPLLDDLLLSSQSGTITVQVTPQPASKSAPAPADLEAQTASGSIKIDFPIAATHGSSYSPLSRDYITRVHSTSGSISGAYYLGSESSFKTTSGTIDITTLPVLPLTGNDESAKTPPNTFETHTVSGTTTAKVLDPIFLTALILSSRDTQTRGNIPINDKPSQPPKSASSKLRSMRSAHSSNTGTVKAYYPDAWQGSVHAKTVSGDITVQGEGFRTVKSRNGWAFREVLKRRGVQEKGEGSVVEMSNISGTVDFIVE